MIRFSLVLLTLLATDLCQAALPVRAVIPDVPYVSWHEVAQLDYPDKDIGNPSIIASFMMIYGYWGETPSAVIRRITKGDQPRDWQFELLAGKDLEELKGFIARGIPVFLSLPLTTEGHPLYSNHAIMASMVGFKVPELGACSPLHGPFLSLQNIEGLRSAFTKKRMDIDPLSESLHMAARILVGYDDERRTFLLHDPTFGPGWEVSYGDFEKMWAARLKSYSKFLPPNYKAVAKDVVPSSPYRKRTGNEHAAWHILRGCCLSACGKYHEAEEEIATALSIGDISSGYRHLLLYELSLHQARRNDYEAAISSALESCGLLPENYLVWDLLGILYLKASEAKPAKDAQHKAMKMKNSSKSSRKMAASIPSDYFIRFLGRSRGWASPGRR